VLVTLGIALEEVRLDDKLPTGVHLLILAVAAAAIYALGVQVVQQGRPYAFQSVLLACGLLLLFPALLTLADVLGADFDEFPAGALVWTSLLYAGAALYPAVARSSSICALIGALALGPGGDGVRQLGVRRQLGETYRWLLALAAIAYVIVCLALRGAAPRHSEQMANAAGLAGAHPRPDRDPAGAHGLPVPVRGAGGRAAAQRLGARSCSPPAAGSSPTARSTARPDRPTWGSRTSPSSSSPQAVSDEDTLLYWPALILALGVGTMFAGLRPREPLPPEPSAYTTGDVPLASRTEDEPVLRVRDDSPPS
jgi:hypothetical protein